MLMLILLICGPHFENHWHGLYWWLKKWMLPPKSPPKLYHCSSDQTIERPFDFIPFLLSLPKIVVYILSFRTSISDSWSRHFNYWILSFGHYSSCLSELPVSGFAPICSFLSFLLSSGTHSFLGATQWRSNSESSTSWLSGWALRWKQSTWTSVMRSCLLLAG